MKYKISCLLAGLSFLAAAFFVTSATVSAEETVVAKRPVLTHSVRPSRPNQPTTHPGHDPHQCPYPVGAFARKCCDEGVIDRVLDITFEERIACCGFLYTGDLEMTHCCITNDRDKDFIVDPREKRECPTCDTCDEAKRRYGRKGESCCTDDTKNLYDRDFLCCVNPAHCVNPCEKPEAGCRDRGNDPESDSCQQAKCCREHPDSYRECQTGGDCLDFNCCWNECYAECPNRPDTCP